MKEIKLSAKSIEETVRQIQQHIGGTISEQFGEYTLDIDNEIAKGCIRFITFDWGVSLTEHNLIYFKDMLFVSDTKKFNPIHFIYCSKGSMYHRFSYEDEFNQISEFHSGILASKKSVSHNTFFPKGQHL
ncbi:MAG: hypothetical protein R2797_11625 [Gelidibacter sp.]